MGERRALQVMTMITRCLEDVMTAKPPRIGLDCDAELTYPPPVVFLLHADNNHPIEAMMIGICRDFATRSDEELMAAAGRRLSGIWTDGIRVVNNAAFHTEGGHA